MPNPPRSISSSPMPRLPLLLPRFIFLAGVSDEKERGEIQELICSSTLNTIPDSFKSLLREAVGALAFCGMAPLEDSTMTPFMCEAQDMMNDLHSWLKETYGPGALGELVLSSARRQDDLWDNLLYIDADSQDDIIPFFRHYGANECLVLVKNWGAMGGTFRLQREAESQGEPFRVVSGWNSPQGLIGILRDLELARPSHGRVA